MTITIPLPDWTAWNAWLQTPTGCGGILYWHVVAVLGYLLVCYVGMFLLLAHWPDAPRHSGEEEVTEGLALLLSGLLFPFCFLLVSVCLLVRLVSLPLVIYRRRRGVVSESERLRKAIHSTPDSEADLLQ